MAIDCAEPTTESTTPVHDEEQGVDISPEKDGGVFKRIIQNGEGEELPPEGCKVIVHYTGTLTDGTKFDSSRDRDSPFEFNLGKGSVIKAWDIGVATMKKGERAMLTCAAKYAYGEAGSPPNIPPNATLKFDVEVIEWKGEDLSSKKDGGIERVQVISPGTGFSCPNDGAVVEVHVVGKYEGREFDNRDVTFTVGEGTAENVIYGIDKAIEKFKKGEQSRLIIQPRYAFGTKGSTEYQIPPDAIVEYTVLLKNFEKAKEAWSLDENERIEYATTFKEKGTNYFKANKMALAIKMYKKVITYLESFKDVKDCEKLLLAAHSNLALCYLQEKKYFEAKKSAESALEIEPTNEKALFRRGQANHQLGETDMAIKDFTQCLEINPANKAAQNQRQLCQQTRKEQIAKEKKLYANMFDKFAARDQQREDLEKKQQLNVLSSVGEWGQEDREREPSEFEKENPDIILLNGTGEFKDM